MAFFTDPAFIKLAVLGCAFFVGVVVCFYVIIKETAELNHRRRAKKLMYQDQVQRELERKKFIMEQIQHRESDSDPIDQPQAMQRSNFQSFA